MLSGYNLALIRYSIEVFSSSSFSSGARHVYLHESSSWGRRFMRSLVDHNGVSDRVTIMEKCPTETSPDELVGPVRNKPCFLIIAQKIIVIYLS